MSISSQQDLSDFQVAGSCNLNVFAITLNERDGMAKALNH
jgi:hypothetical protein